MRLWPELLELFSMGVGMDGQPNYTEDDVKACARAFTGWTISTPIPRYPYGVYTARFIYHPEDHDDGEKTFLGETGTGMARISSTSSPSSQRPLASCHGTCITSSWPMMCKYRHGRTRLRGTPRPSKCWRMSTSRSNYERSDAARAVQL